MRDRNVATHAEWALNGKTSSDRGFRLLNWSEGALSERNFTQLLSRYSPGVLTELPQVTASYAKSELREQQYVALAIHHDPPDGRVDADKRPVVFTSYFCVPYGELAGHAVSYLALYDAFRKVILPEAAEDQPGPESRPPLPVKLAVHAPERPGTDDLALTVAALLLTNRPVCILGAGDKPTLDRLWFIDRVMSLLPYGLRPRMSAATWANRNYASHKFRLFFSDTPRDADEPDHNLTWDAPPPQIPHDYPYARAYLDWLIRLDLPVERLANYTDILGFAGEDVDILCKQLGVTSAPAQPGHGGRPPRTDPAAPGRPAPSPGASQATEIERLLASCNLHLTRGDPHALREAIVALRDCTGYPEHLTEERRAIYREKIASYQLFHKAQSLNKQLEMAFYNTLLRAGFGLPLSYVGYRQLEDCLGGQRPHHLLLQAIIDGGLMIRDDGRAADPVMPLLVMSYMGNDRALWKWLRSDQVSVRQLLHALAGDWAVREHANIVLDVTVDLIRDMDKKGRLPDLRPTLTTVGFLESAVERRHPGQAQGQVDLFKLLLRAAYRNPLTGDDAEEILAAGIGHPTPNPLFYAVMLMMDTRGGSVDQVTTGFMRAFLGYVIDNSGLNAETTHELGVRMLYSGPLHKGQARGTLAIEAPPVPAHRSGPPSPPSAEEDQPPTSRDKARGRWRMYPEWLRAGPSD